MDLDAWISVWFGQKTPWASALYYAHRVSVYEVLSGILGNLSIALDPGAARTRPDYRS
jgi:hypothetical protein